MWTVTLLSFFISSFSGAWVIGASLVRRSKLTQNSLENPMNILAKYFLSNVPKWTYILTLPHLLVMFTVLFTQNSVDVKFASVMLFGAHLLIVCLIAPLCEKLLLKLSVNILIEKLELLPEVGNALSYKGSKGHRRSKGDCIELLATLVIKEQSHTIISHNDILGLERKEGFHNGPYRMVFYAKAENTDAIWVG